VSEFRRKGLILSIVVMAGTWGASAALAQSQDSTLENAQRLLRRAVSATVDTPLAQNPDAGQVITVLRSTRDKDLLPIFDKMRHSTVPENQVYGMVASAVLSKDAKLVDLPLLFSVKDTAMVGSALASLIEENILTNDQLVKVMTDAPESAHRAIAASELNKRKELKDRGPLMAMLKDEKEIVRYYAAVTILSSPDPNEVNIALQTLKDLSAKHDLRQSPVQALMLLRCQKEKLTVSVPWAVQIASDEKCDEGLRYTAVAVLLSFKAPEGSRILSDMIGQQKETIQQVKLGLISLEFSDQVKPASLDPLANSRSNLAKSIGTLAQKAAGGADSTAGLLALLKEGHPIVLDWALSYSDRTDTDRQIAIRTALVNQATIVDNVRDKDYERAVMSTQKLLDENGAAGRRIVEGLLKSDNRAVVEAALAGIYRSSVENQADLVMPIWEGLTRTTSTETAANYAALILARAGRKEPVSWLPGMVVGGTVQGQGFRALAGWYYAKLKGQTGELLKYALSD
jgi:hypothetical protein